VPSIRWAKIAKRFEGTLLDAARPEPVDEHAEIVATSGVFVYPYDRDPGSTLHGVCWT